MDTHKHRKAQYSSEWPVHDAKENPLSNQRENSGWKTEIYETYDAEVDMRIIFPSYSPSYSSLQ